MNHVGGERLLAVAEDVNQAAVDRVAAIVAVSAQLSVEERQRLRDAARTTVDDDLRSATEQALDPAADEAALAEVLTELEAQRDAGA